MMRVLLSVTLLFPLAGCGDPPDPIVDATEDAPGPAAGAPASTAVALDDAAIDQWLAAMVELRAAGMALSERAGQDPNALKSVLASTRLSTEWQAVLDRHGLTNETFQALSGAVTGALAAVVAEDNRETVATSIERQLETMKRLPGVTEEQLAQVRKSMQESQTQLDALTAGATPAARALVRRERARIEAALR